MGAPRVGRSPQGPAGTAHADDLVVLCAGEVEPAFAVLRRVLERLELDLNEAKTRVLDAREDGFDFLGFTFRVRRSRVSGKAYPHVQPSKRAIRRIGARIRELTQRRRTPVPLPVVVGQLNQALRGWSGYFHYGNSSRVFGRVKWHAEERLRTHLRKRYKLKDRGSAYRRLPSPRALHLPWPLQASHDCRLDPSACRAMKNIG